ncbi:transposase [Brevibacterium otitidis]|uniref:Transposase n=1 Tax=Brevibacterium otitidis TaxID=53364 RepID=A0ABV5X739_9MICO|nr:transposase [Brevibacterium otitidis]
MPKPYPREFRDDVIRLAQNRDENTTIGQIAADFGIHEGTLHKWLRQADLDAGKSADRKPSATTDECEELRQLRRRNRALEQELEVMRRAAAYFGQAQIPSK